MKAKLRHMLSYAVDGRLEDYLPENPYSFLLYVRLDIGPDDSLDTESFELTICTPDMIEATCNDRFSIWGLHTLIVKEYDFPKIQQEIERQLEKLEAPSWDLLALQLGRIASWEFADYVPA